MKDKKSFLTVILSQAEFLWMEPVGFLPGLSSAFLRIPQGSADQDNNGNSKGK